MNVFDCEHPDRVLTSHLFHFYHRLAVRVAAVAQSRTEIAVQDGIYCQNVVALRIILVTFVGYVIEVRQIFAQTPFVLSLL